LTGRTEVAGQGADFEQLKPTLRGRGKVALADARLVGINLAAQALGKTQNIPGVGDLVPRSIAQNHPAMFTDPDTRIDSATLTFDLTGPRVTTGDLLVQAPDYRLTGDGWFDLDRQIDLDARILLSPALSGEIEGVKKDVVYLTNKQGEVVVPLRITGTLPKVIVLPNLADLAQRAASRAVERKGKEAVEKFLKKKGLGGLFGGGSGEGGSTAEGTAPAPGSAPTPGRKDPLAPFLRKLF
ncbi:MAG: AsmA-like C-terminal region-containing protein, partial [Candidatus Binataceae bacterium]